MTSVKPLELSDVLLVEGSEAGQGVVLAVVAVIVGGSGPGCRRCPLLCGPAFCPLSCGPAFDGGGVIDVVAGSVGPRCFLSGGPAFDGGGVIDVVEVSVGVFVTQLIPGSEGGQGVVTCGSGPDR
jgi:hypothetical protein